MKIIHMKPTDKVLQSENSNRQHQPNGFCRQTPRNHDATRSINVLPRESLTSLPNGAACGTLCYYIHETAPPVKLVALANV